MDTHATTGAGARARPLLFRLLAIALAIALTLAIAEGLARIGAKAVGRERALAFHRELGWRPLPHLSKKGSYWGVTRPARTNSRGWRDAEHAFEKPPGVRRAVLLGDSFAFGLFVDDGDRLSELLERRFENLEVVNMGVTAWGTDQQLLALEAEGFRYSPDVVVLLAFPHNDLDDIRKERNCSWPKPRFELVDGGLELVKPRLTWDVRVRSMSYCAEFLYQCIRTKETDERVAEGWESRDPVPLFGAIVARMAEKCRARDVDLVALVAYPPERLATGPTDAERRAVDFLREAGFATCDTLEAFRARAAEGENLYADDDLHWNALGNEVAAEELARLLLDLGWAG